MRPFDVLPRLIEVPLQIARHTGAFALSALRELAAPLLGHGPDDRDSGWQRTWEPASARPVGEPPPPPPPPAPPKPAPEPVVRRVPKPEPPSAPEPEPPAPAHVDREAVVVAESADAGAAEGAGATIHVDEPWRGYDMLKARDVAAQLATADAATLAVVRLYESTHRKRRTVLGEIDRRLTASAG